MMWKHVGEQPHSCKQYNYTSTFSDALQIHIMTHTGEKPLRITQTWNLSKILHCRIFGLKILHHQEKTQQMGENGEIYTAGKKFTLPPAVTAWTNLTAAVTCPFVSKYWLCFWILEILNLKGI